MRATWPSIAVGVAIGVALFYAAACVYVRTKRQEAFNAINVGDTAASVVARFGNPSVRETPEELFSRYASTKCQFPCAERMWFENRLTFDLEAWSVSIGTNGRVIEKYHWVSP
jgi:hypothetical protein